jgi:hypothetical protein
MSETMREYLKRRGRWYVALFLVGLALVFLPSAVVAIVGRRELLHEYREQYALVRVLGLLFLAAASVLRSRVKCPKCNKPLGSQARWNNVPAFCPNCGVNFDEPMPQNPIAPIS